MTKWAARYPGVMRIVALVLAAVGAAFLGTAMHQPVNWEIAIVYGAATGVARRWPLVMPKTGSRVIFLVGLLLHALWSYGLATALVLACVDFLIRVQVSERLRSFWTWGQSGIAFVSLLATYGLYVLMAGGTNLRPATLAPPTDSASFMTSYAYWSFLNATWAIYRGRTAGRDRLGEFWARTQQGWWVPLAYLAVAWLMGAAQSVPLPLVIPVCLLLLWAQSLIGPAFTGYHQDRAVSDLVRQALYQGAPGRRDLQRAFRIAGAIAREVGLSAEETRVIGYAAMLQDRLVPGDPVAPLWLPAPPTPEQTELIGVNMAAVVARVEQQGSLQEVAGLIRLRYVAYDGSGMPDLRRDAIPVEALVLSAANALVALTGGAVVEPMTLSQAVTWLHEHASARFSPEILGALDRAFIDSRLAMGEDSALPEMVRQLQELIRKPVAPSTVQMGLRRLWTRLRDRTGWFAGLPDEVLAVARLASYFASSTTVAGTARLIVQAAGELVGGKVIIGLTDPRDEGRLTVQATYGMHHLDLNGRTIQIQAHVLSQAILSPEPFQIADLREINNVHSRELARIENVRSVLVVPMSGQDRTRGYLLVGVTHYHWFTPREASLIQLMAGLAAIALDNANLITEVADRLDHISELKSFTDTLLDNLSTGIAVIEPNGTLRMINHAARTLYDPARTLVPGGTIPEQLESVLRYREALAGHLVPETDVPWGSITLEVQSAPLRGQGNELLGAVCLARDVTLVRRMEQQMRRVEKLAAMGELAAGAAHEIRNPLTSIRGFIQLAGARDQGNAEFFQIVLSEIDRIDSIIRDMLLLARPADPTRVPVPLESLVEEVLRLQDPQLREHRVRVLREYEAGIVAVPVDHKMMRQMLLNLILNAAQAMPGGGTLQVSIRRADADHVALAVIDSGVGISAENMGKLFVPFFTTKEEGTGLGLPMCYSIIRAHDGRIDVHSVEGEGTTITVTLPL